MSYGVQITIKYTETTANGTITTERDYSFHVDTATNACDLITETAKNAKEMNAVFTAVISSKELQFVFFNTCNKLYINIIQQITRIEVS